MKDICLIISLDAVTYYKYYLFLGKAFRIHCFNRLKNT